MATTVTIRDETAAGHATHELTLELMSAEVTARELIRIRVYEEVREYNRTKANEFKGLVQPAGAERAGTGYRLKEPREIDWEQQFEQALQAFDTNGFLLLVDGRQIEHLDDKLDLGVDTKIAFVRLLPLVGG